MSEPAIGGGDGAARIYHAAATLPPVRPDRPLVVLDVDEVVLAFLDGLDAWLAELGLHLARDSFALNGNVRRADGTPVETHELRDLLHGFFAGGADSLAPLPGALDGIAALAGLAEIVYLSNLPAAAAGARRTNLDGHGLAHPLIVNEGPKGPALARLTAAMAAPAVFVDDSPGNIASASEAAGHVHLVHFVADAGFRARVAPHPGIGLLTGDWDEAARHVADHIAATWTPAGTQP